MNVKHAAAAVIVSCLALAGGARAQDAKGAPELPKPGPEVKKLGYFVGSWKLAADMKSGPMGSGGKISGSSTCSWFEGGFAVVCKDASLTPIGPMKGLGVLAWNAEEKTYEYYGVESGGMTELARGRVENDTWVYTNDLKMNGKPFKGRYTISNVKPGSYDFKWETSEDGAKWTTAMDGTYTRAGGAKRATGAKKPS